MPFDGVGSIPLVLGMSASAKCPCYPEKLSRLGLLARYLRCELTSADHAPTDHLWGISNLSKRAFGD